MKKKSLIILLFLVFTNFINAQEMYNPRYIEVTGSAEIKIVPDEIIFQIGIEEYWKEEFEKGKEHKDYVTKIPLEKIEKNVMSALDGIGITNDQIIIKEIGHNWNGSGKNFKKSKTIELIVTDFSSINKILTKVNVKGVNSMKITELKNKDITNYRKQVKIEAMKAAKKKAAYLLESVDEKLGRVISVVELNGDSGYFRAALNMSSNTMVPTNSSDDSNENMKKIKLKYEIKIRFEIE